MIKKNNFRKTPLPKNIFRKIIQADSLYIPLKIFEKKKNDQKKIIVYFFSFSLISSFTKFIEFFYLTKKIWLKTSHINYKRIFTLFLIFLLTNFRIFSSLLESKKKDFE